MIFKLLLMISISLLANTLFAASYTHFPDASDEQLRTPGVGFQEHISRMPNTGRLANCSYDESLDSSNPNDVKAGSIYVRMMWQDFEPSEGNYAWDKLDSLFECARSKNQTIDLRVMLTYPGNTQCYSQELQEEPGCQRFDSLPQWLLNKGVDPHLSSVYSSYDYNVPNWSNATLWQAHKELIQALGERYDGHPELNSVDIGSAGIWGEWHIYGDSGLMPTIPQQKAIIDIYVNAFQKTPLAALVGAFDESGINQVSYGEVAEYLRSKNIGWRADSWGHQADNGYFHNRYNTLNNYLNSSPSSAAAWKVAPVTMETSSTLSNWVNNSDYMSITQAMDDALAWNASLIHNKSTAIPEEFKAIINEKAKKLGFRFELESASYENSPIAGSNVNINMNWKNVGVAPAYRDYRVAFRLRDTSGNVVATSVNVSDETVKGWLPNTAINKTVSYPLPNTLAEGNYSLDVGIVLEGAQNPYRVIPIAVVNRTDDDWHNIGLIAIQKQEQEQEQGSDTFATLQDVTVQATYPNAEYNPSHIIDGNPSTEWTNDGNQNTAHFTVALNQAYLISKILYKGSYDYNMKVSINGDTQFSGWLSTGGALNSDGYYELDISPPVTSSAIKFETIDSVWLTAQEVQVVGQAVNDDNNDGNNSAPSITSHADGVTLNGSTIDFSWVSNGYNVSDYWLDIGTSATSSDDIYSQKLSSSVTRHTVENLPNDGSTIYVRLYYNDQFDYVSYQFTSGN